VGKEKDGEREREGERGREKERESVEAVHVAGALNIKCRHPSCA